MADWRLKKPDGTEYGPVSMDALRNWARDGRITPGDRVAANGGEWEPAEQIEALELDWTVTLKEGSSYGPLSLSAVLELLADGELTLSTRLENRKDGRSGLLRDILTTPSETPVESVKDASEIESLRAQCEELKQRTVRLKDQLAEAVHKAQVSAREASEWKQKSVRLEKEAQAARRTVAQNRVKPTSEKASPTAKRRRSSKDAPEQPAPRNYSSSYIYSSRHKMDRKDMLKQNKG